jgi:hypothetical protein
MIWRILKKLLSAVTMTVHYRDGDMVRIKIMYANHIILDREFDIMPGV